jgi:hypothetical protein
MIAGLCYISEVVRSHFEHEDPSRVRSYIRQKLNNADKIVKRKTLKHPSHTESDMPVDTE